MDVPKSTRLRYASSKDPAKLVAWLGLLNVRVQIYGSPQYDGKRWYLWFVPDDKGADIPSVELDKIM